MYIYAQHFFLELLYSFILSYWSSPEGQVMALFPNGLYILINLKVVYKLIENKNKIAI